MSLHTGARLGPYEVSTLLGIGGMGEVYRARDTKLNRDVAIKVLPDAVATDPDRLARFHREAQLLAALNHPNIAHIHGYEDSGSVHALIMELVEGPTLADRIAKGPIPVAETVSIARQVADALETAHEQGIVHRDLKPANVKLRPDGTVKVLDFGLAKAVQLASPADVTLAPTKVSPDVTRHGVILGTPAYMSPEQARGKPVDKRTDIWSFGCVLYEMLTGRSAFHGETLSDTIVSTLERDPDWSQLPRDTPAGIQRLLRRSLEKDPKRRLRDIGDALIELEQTSRSGVISGLKTPGLIRGHSRRNSLAIAGGVIAFAFGAAALGLGSRVLGRSVLDASSFRFTPIAVEPEDETSPSWSPDEKSIVYSSDVDGVRQVVTRAFDAAAATQITKCSTDCVAPFWSPNGTRIYFITFAPGSPGGTLWSIGATGGEPQRVLDDIAAATLSPRGDTLAFLRGAGGNRSLWLTQLAKPAPQRYRTPPFPETFGLSTSLEFSPDGTKIGVLVRRPEGVSYTSEVWIVPYPSGTPRRVLERIPEAAASRLSWAADSRHIVWDSAFPDRLGGHLYVADTEHSTIQQITFGTLNEVSPSVSHSGDRIAFAAGSDDADLVRIPLDGSAPRTLLASSRSESRPTWSPTGTLAYVSNARGASEIWVRSLAEGWARPLIKRDSGNAASQAFMRPSFSPDGQHIVYEMNTATHRVWVASVVDGRGVPLDSESPDEHSPAWSPDGKWIAYQRLSGTNWDLVKVPFGGGSPVRIGEATPGGGDHTAWSPTGEWIAHVRRGVLVLTAADGRSEKSVSGPAPAVFGFSHDGSSLYVVRHSPNRKWVLVTFDVRSIDQRSAIDLNLPPSATLSGFSLHPDGKSFATGMSIARHDIWVLDGFKLPSRWFDRF